MRAVLIAIGAVVLLQSAGCQMLDLEGGDSWVDPNDPSSSMGGGGGGLLGGVASQGQCSNENSDLLDDPSLRLILRRLFQQIHVDPSQKAYFSRISRLTLSSYNMAIVGDYLDGESGTSEIAQRELVRGALHNMFELIDEDEKSIVESALTFLWPWMVLCNMVVLPAAFFFVLRNIMSTRSFWITFISIIVLVSMVATYNKMYQEKVAARLAAATEMKGDACAPAGLIEQGLDFLSGFVTLKKKSPCLKFIETQTVSIVAEISLLDVFTHVVSNGLFGWLSNLGSHLNKFYRDLCDGIPFHMLILIFGSMVFLFVRIRTPLFSIEPLFITLMGNVAGVVVQGLTGDERREALPAGNERQAVGGGQDRFHRVTLRTPERVRRLQERRRQEQQALPAPESEENTLESEDDLSSSRSRSRSRSISRGRVPQ